MIHDHVLFQVHVEQLEAQQPVVQHAVAANVVDALLHCTARVALLSAHQSGRERSSPVTRNCSRPEHDEEVAAALARGAQVVASLPPAIIRQRHLRCEQERDGLRDEAPHIPISFLNIPAVDLLVPE